MTRTSVDHNNNYLYHSDSPMALSIEHSPTCPNCLKWISEETNSICTGLCKKAPASGLFRISTTMCCVSCKHYNIFLVTRDNNWKPEIFRSKCKFQITSTCYLLGLDVPQPFEMYSAECPKRHCYLNYSTFHNELYD